jgi:hypothetical protein
MSSEDLIREAGDPATTPARLAELAGADQATWPAIAGNPAAYDGLLTWLGERNVPAVDAALTARAEAAARAALPPVPPPAPAVPAPPTPPAAEIPSAAPVAPEPAPEPTVVVPAQPTYEEPAYGQPTAQQPAAASEPTAVFAAPASAPEPTATQAFGAVPPAGTGTPAATADGDGGHGSSGRNLAVVIAMVAVVLALIAGAAWGATEVFGGDDEPSVSASDNDEADDDDSDSSETPDAPEESEPAATIPTIPEDDDSEAPAGEFCSTMKEIQDTSMAALDTDGGAADLEGMQDMAEQLAESYDDLRDSAPAELAADVEVMASYFELLENPDADAASKMSESISEYSEAAQNVGVYYAQNCL